jgi:hypothetical protein
MRLLDTPMALGRKVEKPVAKKPDPVADFERGDHRVAGMLPEHAFPYIGRSIPDMVTDDLLTKHWPVFVDPALGPDEMVMIQRSGRSMGESYLRLKQIQDEITKAMIATMQLTVNPPLIVKAADAAALLDWPSHPYSKG